MSNISKELIESYRKIVLPFVSSHLYRANFEGQGAIDRAEFEQDFNEILNLAISALNPSGDCISREALKEKAYTAVILEPDEKGIDYVKGKRYVVDLDDIDNAQTVQPKYSLLPLECTDMEDAFNRGYRAGKIEGIMKASTRPQGEWYYNCQNGWHCSICHETIKDMPTVMGKADFNFCPNCGADMRGGTE